MTVAAIEAEHAYRECEDLTRRAAANFYYGIRLLPRDKRQAMSAVYAFARRIDDIGDEAGAPDDKLAALDAEREKLAAVSAASAGTQPLSAWLFEDSVTVAVTAATHRFNLPLDAFELLIDGVEADVREARYESFAETVGYCRAVAGTIGRLCLAIFSDGMATAPAFALADDLGVAMQLTNILRDVREDWGNGRIYLPAEDFARFGAATPEDIPVAMVQFEAARAREWFDRGLGLLDLLDARSASCVLAMTGIYRRILDRIEANPQEILEHRISLPTWEKAWLAARSLAGVRA
jgi:phytoene synthase